jgi:serine/threonine protein phosphatase PrpC
MSERIPEAPKKRSRQERKERGERFGYAARTFASESRVHENQDAYLEDAELNLIGVFDGLGGYAGGREAAQAAAAAVLEEIRRWDTLTEDEIPEIMAPSLASVLRSASKHIISKGQDLYLEWKEKSQSKEKWRSPQTTATIARLHEFADGHVGYYIAHVGDSRAYIWRHDGDLEQVTQDDDIMSTADGLTEIEMLFGRHLTDTDIQRYRALIDEADGENEMPDAIGRYLFRSRNQITQSLGDEYSQGAIRVHTYTGTLKPGDLLFLTSDGVHDNLTRQRIRDIAASVPDADALVDRLAHEAYEYGHAALEPFDPNRPVARNKRDDITVVAVRIS